MNFLSKIFSRYQDRVEKARLVKSVIENLRISPWQKKMYLDSVDMLDADALDVFYRQLQELFDFLDQRDSIEEQKKIHEQVVSIRMRDDSDKADDNTEFLIQTL